MKLIVCIVFMAMFFTGCKREAEKYSTSCTDIWRLSPGVIHTKIKIVDKVKTTTVSTDLLSDEYIVRCCELIDGGDNPAKQSAAEGTCMVELLSSRSELMDSVRKKAAVKIINENVRKLAAEAQALAAKTAKVKEAQAVIDKAAGE